jgi:hypothetical protein
LCLSFRMVEQPTIQCADTDGNGPAKRRRRPALSCVECRMRKVKCDRAKPCGACTKIKSATCTFRPTRPGIRSERSERSPEDDTSTGHSNDQEQEYLPRSSPQPSGPSDDFDAMMNRYVAPGLLGECGGKLKPLPTDRPSFNLNSQSDSAQASIISSLLDRIHGLEEKLASVTLNDQPKSRTPPRRESSGATSGQFVKSKFYGESHWINAIDPVSEHYSRSCVSM